MESQQESAVWISIFVVVNLIWWMVMIAAIGVGAMHFHSCPLQPKIPIYLMVLGLSSLLALSLTYIQASSKERVVRVVTASCHTILHIFSFFWFIAGTTWVYSSYPPDYSPGESRYCEQTLYLFAFYVTSLCWFLVFLTFFYCSVFLMLACCNLAFGRQTYLFTRGGSYGAISDFREPGATVGPEP